MINISELSLNFSGEPLFKDVNLKFTQGNCYGVIGANGAGKSTFLRILSGDLDPSTGTVSIAPKTRMSVLKQDHFAFNDETVLNTVLGGNERLLAVMREKDALYMKDPCSRKARGCPAPSACRSCSRSRRHSCRARAATRACASGCCASAARPRPSGAG